MAPHMFVYELLLPHELSHKCSYKSFRPIAPGDTYHWLARNEGIDAYRFTVVITGLLFRNLN